MTLREELVGKLISERKRQKLTQADVARSLHVAPSVISRFESGAHSPRLETLYDVARVLGLRMDVKVVAAVAAFDEKEDDAET